MAYITEGITDVLNTLCALWTRMNQPQILDLWDKQELHTYLLPQEKGEPINGWDSLQAYYRQANERLVRCFMRVWNINAKLLSEGWQLRCTKCIGTEKLKASIICSASIVE